MLMLSFGSQKVESIESRLKTWREKSVCIEIECSQKFSEFANCRLPNTNTVFHEMFQPVSKRRKDY